ncbi:uncharacterized protein MYCFIDRAFT_172983 [Pseudocercospora fijiensis CIRAD86]|uniref:Uncharacterized protein n=1 Tax=Pseudocercospora fijiensis (strain CIRAD86) TaxID=383855 RepID=M3B3E8_PSEFD|nr:uncharacterized protein MYCFIDRAFT_172983 [Pseudocercospora fijiensis CIRAD86]EME83913.1 hypothetical protein MYCFIDRAFT_172983 [Pseudocercospora fijiensis CIRAD86]
MLFQIRDDYFGEKRITTSCYCYEACEECSLTMTCSHMQTELVSPSNAGNSISSSPPLAFFRHHRQHHHHGDNQIGTGLGRAARWLRIRLPEAQIHYLGRCDVESTAPGLEVINSLCNPLRFAWTTTMNSQSGSRGAQSAGPNFYEWTPVSQYHSIANCKKILRSRGIRIPGISRSGAAYLNTVSALLRGNARNKLLRFCNQRGLSVNSASASKPELISTLEHADATPTFERMADLPPEIRLMIFDFHYAPLGDDPRNHRDLRWNSTSPPIPPPLQQACVRLWPACAEPYYQECDLVVEVNCIWDSEPIRFSLSTQAFLSATVAGVFKYIRRVFIVAPALAEEGTRLKTAWRIDLDETDPDQRLVQVGLPWHYMYQSRMLQATSEAVYKALQEKVLGIQKRAGNKTLLKTDVLELKEVFVKLLADHGSHGLHTTGHLARIRTRITGPFSHALLCHLETLPLILLPSQLPLSSGPKTYHTIRNSMLDRHGSKTISDLPITRRPLQLWQLYRYYELNKSPTSDPLSTFKSNPPNHPAKSISSQRAPYETSIMLCLALRVHPDRAPAAHLRELHTSLFQKLFNAYETLSKHFDNGQDHMKMLPSLSRNSSHAKNENLATKRMEKVAESKLKEVVNQTRSGALEISRSMSLLATRFWIARFPGRGGGGGCVPPQIFAGYEVDQADVDVYQTTPREKSGYAEIPPTEVMAMSLRCERALPPVNKAIKSNVSRGGIRYRSSSLPDFDVPSSGIHTFYSDRLTDF